MQRRAFMAGAAATALARPAIAAGTAPLVFVPQTNLTSLDPVWTTATVTRNFALMVYENLYGRDNTYVPRPLMVAAIVIEDDGKRWTMKLRDGLLFHDGTKVLARDCVASLQRWMKRDPTGADHRRPGRCDRGAGRPDPGLAAAASLSRCCRYFLSKAQPQPVIDAGTPRRDRSVSSR